MMEVAPGPLMRTQTAPAHHARSLSQARGEAHIPPRGHSLTPGHPPLPTVTVNGTNHHHGNHSNNNSNHMGFLGGSKPPPPPPPPAAAAAAADPSSPDGGGSGISKVVASDSIINQVADSSKSLYQICVKLRQRLAEVPGFQPHREEMENEATAEDPMTAMWKCLKKGYPLLTVYNALDPAAPIEIDPAKVPEAKRPIAAAYKFSEACKTHLNFPSEECFLIKDLYGDDTTGFVKVIAAVNHVLDILQARNLLLPPDESQSPSAAPETTHKKTRRDFIIGELVDTERKYVQHLESLQQFKVAVEEKGEVPGDKVHAIFLNLNALLDFQRRFLIRIETVNSLPEAQQNWGRLFTQSQDSFRVYEPYIANQQHGEEQAMLEFDKLHHVGHPIAADRATLSGFLTKPFQRLSKYPLLLKELRDKCEAEEHIKEDLSAGIHAASSILERANAAIDKEQRHLVVEELQQQVDDWKGHNLEQFGELLLYGTFAVVKTDGKADLEKDYRVYLFERILLCCKELNPAKQKNNFINMNRPPTDRKAKPRMQLKGRIFMQNVTETLSLQKPGSYTVQIFWKGDPGVENFVIRFNNEEVMKKWYTQVEVQRKTFAGRRGTQGSQHGSSTSDTEFAWVRNQGVPTHNPYKQDDEEDDDHNNNNYHNHNEHHPSSTHQPNLRSESAAGRAPPSSSTAGIPFRPPTGDGSSATMPPMGTRIPPPRFPLGNVPPPQLTLQTHIPSSVPSPAERAAASYFSPTAESPASTRASSSSGMYPFPRQATPLGHWPTGEELNRFTAPVMGRAASREGPAGGNQTRTGNTRPSLPAMASQNNMPPGALAQNRMRSASSPDIHHHGVAGRRLPNGEGSSHYHHQPAPPVPDVPPFPAHVAYKKNTMINRSHTNSPVEVAAGVPKRSGTQSPGLMQQQRERERERMLTPGYGSYHHHQSNNPPSYTSHGSHPPSYSSNENSHPPSYHSNASPSDPRGSSPSITPNTANVTAKSPPMPSTTSSTLSTFSSPNPNTNATTSPQSTTIISLPSPTSHSPTQLKVKVSFESNYVTLVVATNISYQSLVDRIDAKLSRFTSLAIGRGTIRLRYRDEDGDFVTIRSDEDIQLAFSDWRVQMVQRERELLKMGGAGVGGAMGGGGGGLFTLGGMMGGVGSGGGGGGQLGEIQLYCQSMEG